jgi:hypothetical protein
MREHFSSGQMYALRARPSTSGWSAMTPRGVAGLADRNRAPQHFAHKLNEDVIAEIVAARQR